MSSEGWKLEKDLCRCCHGEGAFQNLAEPRYNLGQQEIYSDMLQYCLNIEVTPMTGVLCAMTYTICDSCILRLRDAFNFKKQVLLCEERFKDMYSNVMKALTPNYGVKQEPCTLVIEDIKEELPQMDSDVDVSFDPTFDDDDDDEDDNKTMLQIKQEDARKSKAKAKAKPKPKPKKAPKKIARPKKKATQHTDDDVLAKEDEPKLEKGKDYSLIEPDGGVKKALCHTCDIVYTVSEIEQHILQSHTTRSCPLCEEKFTVNRLLLLHLRETHGVDQESGKHIVVLRKLPQSFQCNCCEKEFNTQHSMRAHKRIVHKVYDCLYCNENFSQSDLIRHQHEIHGAPILSCRFCDMKFTQYDLLNNHERKVHLKEKNVPCPQCDMKFFSSSMLATHMVKHRGEKKFQCSFCDKRFPRKATCLIHEKIHKGEKNKVCSVCNKSFVQLASLNYHMRKYHPEAS